MHFFKTFLVFLAGFNCLSLAAQSVDFNDYTTILSHPPIPVELLSSSSEKYYKEIENDKERDKNIKKIKDDYYLKASFEIDALLRSGLVIYNDPVGNYANKVLDKIKAANNLDSLVVKIYVVKTNTVNAFATDRGIIFITTGLIAKLETEAQLAFILCHELTHVLKKHSMDVFVYRNKGKQKDRKNAEEEINYDKMFLNHSHYSRTKETEADLEGVKLFIKTGYHADAVSSAFDVLRHAELPFSNFPFNYNTLLIDTADFDSTYFLTKVSLAEETYNYDNDDSASTHPDIRSRQESVTKLLENEDYKGDNDFIISKNEFVFVREIARFEACRLALVEKSYDKAIYDAFVLSQNYPGSIFLKKVIGKALYGIAVYHNAGRKKEAAQVYSKTRGEWQKVIHFSSSVSTREVLFIALDYNWTLKQQFPADKELEKICEHIIGLLARDHYTKKESFEDVNKSLENEGKIYVVKKFKQFNKNDTFRSIALKAIDKWNFVLKQKKWSYSAFKSKYGSEIQETDTTVRGQMLRQYYFQSEDKESDLEISHKEVRQKQVGKTAFVAPFYLKIDERKNNPLRRIAGERKQQILTRSIEKCAVAARLPYLIIGGEIKNTGDSTAVNLQSIYNTYVDEMIGHRGLDILPADYKLISYISDTSEINNIAIIGIGDVVTKKENVTQLIIISFAIWTLPFTIPELVMPNYNSIYFCLQLDIKNNTFNFSDLRYFPDKATTGLNKSMIYDLLIQMKSAQ